MVVVKGGFHIPESVEVKRENIKSSDLAYVKLRQAIISLVLEPGSAVDEQSLSKKLELGRTPIREALLQLAREDLVNIFPRKGTFIAPINFASLKEVEELRWHMEGQAARWAAERITTQQLSNLKTLIAEAQAGEFAHISDWDMEVDRQFHAMIADSSHNRYLAQQLDTLYNLSVRLLYASRAQMQSVTEEIYDYEAIITALRAGDAQAAEAAMQQHLEDSRQRINLGFTER